MTIKKTKKTKSLKKEHSTVEIESVHFESGTYKWDLKENIPHGVWSYIYKDKVTWLVITYSGDWKDGKREWSGTESSLSIHFPGMNYIGEWKANQRHGIGKEKSLSPGIIYEGYYGEWRKGKKHGMWVTKISLNGKIAGEFRNGELFNGQILNNGNIFRIVVEGKTVWDIFALIPWIKKKLMPFTKKAAIQNSIKKYDEALEKYGWD
jgi:hypothetical protein